MLLQTLVSLGLAVLLYITAVFIIAWRLRRLDVADIAWGGAFIVAALISLIEGAAGILQILVTGLVLIWGSRLGYYILKRVRRSKEDPRYAEMRSKWTGGGARNAYGRVFLVQGALALVIASSVVWINVSLTTALSGWTAVGGTIWLVGFLFEAIGDEQLKRHLTNSNNQGKLMTSGLWRYTRHPNYFGEAMQWWGIWVIALGVPFGWLTIISPLLITFLLLFVSGVPPTEKRFEGRPGWALYKKQTSVFFPLPHRR